MLRITQVAGTDVAPVFRLEGRLLGPWVAELAQVCGGPAVRASGVCLDLSRLTYVDEDGRRLLQDLLGRGVKLVAWTGLIAEMLHLEKPC
jgi:hypothetical protein